MVEATALVRRVTRPLSTEVRPVSFAIMLESWVAKFPVVTEDAELQAVKADTIAPNIVLVSIPPPRALL